MKKNLFTLLFLIFALPALWANNIYYEITQEKSVEQIGNELQALIDNATGGSTIVVTGSKTDASDFLYLHLPEGKKIFWTAFYQSASSLTLHTLIHLHGNGTFEVGNDGAVIAEGIFALLLQGTNSTVIVSGNGKVQTSGNNVSAISSNGNIEIKDNAHISGTKGETICSNSDNAIVLVSGGTVSATSENAIITWGRNSKIYITGGHVYNNAEGVYHAVYALDRTYGNETLIHVSGTAIVEAKGKGSALASYRDVKVSGNAQVIGHSTGAQNYGAITAYNNVEINDKAKVMTYYYDRAVHSDGITYLNGGMAFAYGRSVDFVINNFSFPEPMGAGVVIAWDKRAGNIFYEIFSTEDISVSPESATAYWDKIDGEYGISYTHKENSGFIPLNVIVLFINENKPSSNLKVFPNPTTGVIYISSEQVNKQTSGQVDEIEVYDILGRKQKVESRKGKFPSNSLEGWQPQADGVVMDISHLPSGIYFVRVNNEVVKVVKQ